MLHLPDIRCQQRAVDMLTRAWQSGRLAHGLLFAGPVGVGKATTARALGALSLCENPRAAAPCGKCQSCRAMQADAHPDFHLVTKELVRYQENADRHKAVEFSVKVVRAEVIARAGLRPALGRGNVFVLEQAELMNPAAQNAMLKSLEEPPPNTMIILLTDRPAELLPTVRSRCQLVPFLPLPREDVIRGLRERAIEPADANAAADLADGSLGRALEFAREGVIERARELFARIDAGDDVHELLQQAADAYAARQLEKDKLGSKAQGVRAGLELYLRLASEHLRRKLEEVAPDPEAAERICAGIESIAHVESLIDGNVNIPIALQLLSIQLRQLAPSKL